MYQCYTEVRSVLRGNLWFADPRFFFGMVENRCVYGSRLFFYFCEIIKSCLFGHHPRMTCRPKLDQLDEALINLFFFARRLALYQHHIRTVRARGNEQDRKEGKKEGSRV